MADHQRLRALFGGEGNRWIADKLRQRLLRGRPLTGKLVHPDPSPGERTAFDDLLGRRSSSAQALRLDLATLRDQLRAAGLIEELDDLVRACFGEVPDLRAAREASAARWSLVFDDALAQVASNPDAREWLTGLRADGSLKRLAGGDPERAKQLLGTALHLWWCLPLPGRTLAELAGETAGDTHALDRGRPLSTLLLRAIRHRTGIDGSGSAQARRRAWESVGVVIDQLSAPALTLNLRAVPGHPLHPILEAHFATALPAFLSYRSFAGPNPFAPLPPGLETVFVVENPALVEIAASRLGRACRPLVCTEGIPASAVTRLLHLLTEAGARLRARADFDWSGLRILDSLVRLHGATPWRMDQATYASAPGDVPLEGPEFSAPWSTALIPVMRHRAVAVHEETVAGILLEDLRV